MMVTEGKAVLGKWKLGEAIKSRKKTKRKCLRTPFHLWYTWAMGSKEIAGGESLNTCAFFLTAWTARGPKALPCLLCLLQATSPPPFTRVRAEAQAPRSPGTTLTLMLLLSMVSKSSGTILGTWLTRLIKKRPTVLSADTFPDWAPRESMRHVNSCLWDRDFASAAPAISQWRPMPSSSCFPPILTSTSSAYCNTVLRASWMRAEAPPTCCKSLERPITRLWLKQVFMISSTVGVGGVEEAENSASHQETELKLPPSGLSQLPQTPPALPLLAFLPSERVQPLHPGC